MIPFKNLIQQSNLRFARKKFHQSKKGFAIRIFPLQSEFFGLTQSPFLNQIISSESTWDPDPGSDLHIVAVISGTQKWSKRQETLYTYVK